MNTHIDLAVRTDDDITTCVPSDPDLQRGRKRRRREDIGAGIGGTRKQIPSGESATLRGRCRHRSTSRVALLSAFSSRSRSRSSCARDREDREGGPHHNLPPSSYYASSNNSATTKKRIFRFGIHLDNTGYGHGHNQGQRRRSQSPSRSRSASYRQPLSSCHDRRRRRRQRTRSRSREHSHRDPYHNTILMGSVVDLKSPLCLEMMPDDDADDWRRDVALED